MMSGSCVRVLFFSEAVTLAHLARPLVLAQSLDSSAYVVQFAVAPRFSQLIDDASLDCRPINSIPSEQFLQALSQGAPIYDAETLSNYVREDLELIDAFKPDVVVGDFRLSLAVSARLAKVPYITITNIPWSPFAIQRYTVPELPFTRFLGPTLAQWVFSLARPLSFALHSRPMHRVRKEFGLPSLGWDLRRVYTDADYTLYVDIPGMVTTKKLPPEHQYIGAVLWSPPVPNPEWWDRLPSDRPIIYLTLGSSGEVDILPSILSALGTVDVSVMVATAGRVMDMDLPDNVFVADYLSGLDALARSSLIICNGGSAPTQQALSLGVPVLGLPSNLDQFMNMAPIVRHGAGMLLRTGRLDPNRFVEAVKEMIAMPGYRQSAHALAQEYGKYSSAQIFQAVLEKASR
jgi:UDP:flavonoid glycosyltransferase YjiC (YdhE family)